MSTPEQDSGDHHEKRGHEAKHHLQTDRVGPCIHDRAVCARARVLVYLQCRHRNHVGVLTRWVDVAVPHRREQGQDGDRRHGEHAQFAQGVKSAELHENHVHDVVARGKFLRSFEELLGQIRLVAPCRQGPGEGRDPSTNQRGRSQGNQVPTPAAHRELDWEPLKNEHDHDDVQALHQKLSEGYVGGQRQHSCDAHPGYADPDGCCCDEDEHDDID